MFKVALSFFLLGLSFSIGPCLVSCGPLLVSYAVGTRKTVFKGALLYIIFSISRLAAYAALSLLIFFFGQMATFIFGAYGKYFYLAGGAFIIMLGLLMMAGANIELKICRKLQNTFLERDKKTVVIIGLIIGILPCAPLISAVSSIGLLSRNWTENLIYTFSFGAGTVISPLFVIVMLAGFIPGLLKNNFYRVFNFICGLIIVFLGVDLIYKRF